MAAWPRAALVRRRAIFLAGVSRGGPGGLVVEAPGDATEHDNNEEMPKRAQGEVPFESRVCGRAGTLSRSVSLGKSRWTIPMRLRPETSGIQPEYFLTTS
jgi:hypothetical protein